jgi:hypothetical protein
VTKLYCPRCRKRCGDGKLLDDDIIQVTAVIQRQRGQYSGRTVHVTREWTLRLSDPRGWPLVWSCQRCRDTAVRLTADQARSVGNGNWLVTDSMPTNS